VQFAGCAALGAGVLFFAGGRLLPSAAAQSLSYTKGQTVAPAYEGWEEEADGKKFFVFGYMNKNWEEELDVPVGAANGFEPGSPDRGQPTHFLPRRNRFVFRVQVPQGFTEKDELVWTLTANGKTMKAYASLRADYKIDDVVIASETGALGAGTSSPTMRANKSPIVKIDGAKTRTVKVGETLTLVTAVTDDGVPKGRTKEQFDQLIAQRARLLGTLGALTSAAAAQNAPAGQAAPAAPAAAAAPRPAAAAAPNPLLQPPARVTVGKNLGLHLSWFVYRGTGDVHFDPPQVKSWEDTRAGANSPWAPLWFAPSLPADSKITATVAFETPGTYVLRALADDGALTGFEDLTVTVTK
jgi:hypothetical protein